MLAQRLNVMRQERDARSKTARKKTPAKVPAMAGPPPTMEMESDFSFDNSFDDSGVVELTGDSAPAATSSSGGGGVGGRRGNPRRSKNKKKKRKNRK